MEAGKALIEEFEMLNLVCQVASEWGAPALIVPKPHANPNAAFVDRFRLVIDYRELNKYIAHDTYEPPSCDLCIGWLAGKPVRSVADMRWGFHQVKVSDRMRKYFTFVTPFGTWSYNRLVMGFINATAEFQRCMNHTLGNCLYRNCVAMVDDLIVASETMDQHVDDLWEVFAKLAARGHSIKPKKLRFIPEEVEYLGIISTPEGIKVTKRHKAAVADMPYPLDDDGSVNVTSLRSGVGLFKFCRKHIPSCAWLCAPLNELTTKEHGEWTDLHSLCWELLKYHVVHSKGLYHIDYKYPIFVCTDGSKKGVGGYIFQRVKGEERVVSYFSRQTTI